jgi:ketosteroid isomerase-like protein
MSRQVYGRYVLPPLREPSRRNLVQRLDLRFPRLGKILRSWAIGLPPAGEVRRRLVVWWIRRAYEAQNRRDYPLLSVWSASKLEMRAVLPPRSNEGMLLDLDESYVGKRAIADFMERWDEAWTDFRFDPDELLDLGATQLVFAHARGSARASGIEWKQPFVHVFTTEKGLLVRLEAYIEVAQALEAVGLSEQDAHADS